MDFLERSGNIVESNRRISFFYCQTVAVIHIHSANRQNEILSNCCSIHPVGGCGKGHIVDIFANRTEEQYFSRLVAYEEIKEQEYNLSVSTYVEAEDTREKIDIVQLNAEIAQIVAREEVLRAEIDKIIAEIEVDA